MTLELPDLRPEWKSLLPASALSEVERRLRTHPAGFHKAYPDRTVNSVYLDDPIGTARFEHRAGIDIRRKLRLRWYSGVKGAFLEMKARTGNAGYKHRAPAFLAQNFEFKKSNLVEEVKSISLQTAKRFPILLPMARSWNIPSAYVSYLRKYFLDRSGKVRVTLDTGLSTTLLRGPSSLPLTLATDVLIVELKASIEDEGALSEVADLLRLPLGGFSKYMATFQGVGFGRSSSWTRSHISLTR